MAFASVGVCLLKFLIAGATVTIGAKVVTLGVSPDAGVLGALLTPVLAAYTTSLHKHFRDTDGDGVPDTEVEGSPSPLQKK